MSTTSSASTSPVGSLRQSASLSSYESLSDSGKKGTLTKGQKKRLRQKTKKLRESNSNTNEGSRSNLETMFDDVQGENENITSASENEHDDEVSVNEVEGPISIKIDPPNESSFDEKPKEDIKESVDTPNTSESQPNESEQAKDETPKDETSAESNTDADVVLATPSETASTLPETEVDPKSDSPLEVEVPKQIQEPIQQQEEQEPQKEPLQQTPPSQPEEISQKVDKPLQQTPSSQPEEQEPPQRQSSKENDNNINNNNNISSDDNNNNTVPTEDKASAPLTQPATTTLQVDHLKQVIGSLSKATLRKLLLAVICDESQERENHIEKLLAHVEIPSAELGQEGTESSAQKEKEKPKEEEEEAKIPKEIIVSYRMMNILENQTRLTASMKKKRKSDEIEGNPHCFVVPLGKEGNEQVMSYRGKDGHIHILTSSNDVDWTHKDVTGDLTLVQASGDPTGYYKIEGNAIVKYIVYKGKDNCVHQLFSSDGTTWEHRNITLRAASLAQAAAAKEEKTTANVGNIISYSPITPPPGGRQASKEEEDKRREQIVNEIYITEKHYVSALEKVVTLFAEPLYSCDFLSPSEAGHMFDEISGLLPHHQNLLRLMSDRVDKWSADQLFGDLFAKDADFLVMYASYAQAFPKMMAAIKKAENDNPQFATFIKKTEQAPELHLEDLHSLLIQPIQRVPRYQLLLLDLYKHTYASHPDYQNIVQGLSFIKAVAKYVNEQKRLIESAETVAKLIHNNVLIGKVDILSNRRYIKEGVLEVSVGKSKPLPRYFYLFNDLILMCEEKKRKGKDSQYHIKQVVPIEQMQLSTAVEDNGVFNLITEKGVLAVYATTPKEKDGWVKAHLDILELQSLDELMKRFDKMNAEFQASRKETRNRSRTIANGAASTPNSPHLSDSLMPRRSDSAPPQLSKSGSNATATNTTTNNTSTFNVSEISTNDISGSTEEVSRSPTLRKGIAPARSMQQLPVMKSGKK